MSCSHCPHCKEAKRAAALEAKRVGREISALEASRPYSIAFYEAVSSGASVAGLAKHRMLPESAIFSRVTQGRHWSALFAARSEQALTDAFVGELPSLGFWRAQMLCDALREIA